MSEFKPVLEASSLLESSSATADVDGVNVLICRSGDQIFAIKNMCSHQSQPLTGGRIRNGCIFCPVHGMRFNLNDGRPMGQLTDLPLTTFKSRVVDGVVEVCVDTSA